MAKKTIKIKKREPTLKQKRAFELIHNPSENIRSMGEGLRKAGYSEETSKAPQRVTETKGWQQLMEEYLPDTLLADVHLGLLKSKQIDHMVFPTKVTDQEIKDLLATANCTVKKIMHGEMANHVWYWTANHRARKDAIDMAYRLKGRYNDKALIDNSKHYHFTSPEKKRKYLGRFEKMLTTGPGANKR